MKPERSFLLSLAGTLLLAAGCAGDLRFEMDLEGDAFEVGDDIVVTWTLSNDGSTAVPFLFHYFPSIWVEDGYGQSPPWIGPMYDYVEPSASMVKRVAPGATWNGEFRVHENYELTSGESYTVRSENHIEHQAQVGVPYWTGDLDAEPLEFTVH